MVSFLEELNEVQKQAAEAIEGPVMVIAGPGSGKTRVLTYRIAHMVHEGIDPFNILALTFTNKAAREMRERIERIVGGNARSLWMGTFHSVFARLLRYKAEKIGYPPDFTIYDTQDSQNLMKTIIKEQNLNDKIYKPNVVLNRISWAKNKLIGPVEYKKNVDFIADDEAASKPKMAMLYELYAKRCFKAGAMDFDDLLFKMWELISNNADILYEFQQRFRYILIDEYQDTNHAQYVITKMLAAMFENICVVGDDAQSIYSFRGANIQNILSFQEDYPDVKLYRLEQNYRSTKNIVKAANELITNNKMQIPKTIWTDNSKGKGLKYFQADSDGEEGRMVADHIFESAMQEKKKYSEFAVLYRTNAQSRSFEESLRKRNIPYRVYGGLSFYQRKEIKDLLAYLKITVNPHDEESLRRVINYPTRGIGKTTVEKLTVFANDNDVSIWTVIQSIENFGFASRTTNNLRAFAVMIESFAAMLEKKDAYELANHIANSTGLLKDLYNDKTVEGVSRYENIQELLNSIKEYTVTAEETPTENPDEQERDTSLSAYLQNVSLLTTQDDTGEIEDHVSLMTLHASKGLEFSNVYIGGVEEGLIPSALASYSREELEEERRLFYVGITRAKEQLVLSVAKTRYRFGKLTFGEESRFISEIPESIIENPRKPERVRKAESDDLKFSTVVSNLKQVKKNYQHKASSNFKADDPQDLQVGMQVEHQRFGFGKVVNMDGDSHNKIAHIFFEKAGNKKIMLRYAKLRIMS